jgi:O-succinylbenzoate synthase
MISLYIYRLKFKKPFITGHDTYTHRKGVLIRYLNNSVDFWSEAAPLPGFSPDTIHDITKFMSGHIEEINSLFTSDFSESDLRNSLQKWPQYPSLQYALSYLGIRLLAHRMNMPAEDFLPFKFSHKLTINDILGITNPDEIQKKLQASYDNGFRTLKIKTGDSPKELAHSLKIVSANFPDLKFRIDANRSWPIGRVNEFSSYFSDLPVEYIEEPSVFSDPTELYDLLKTAQSPVALDESIRDTKHLSEIRKTNPNIYLVIKPALMGNLFTLAETIKDFDSKRHRIVFSTLLESKIGREMTAFTAAKLGDPSLAHGLNTGKLFSEDLLPDFSLNHGNIQVTKCIREKRKPIRFQYLTTMNGIHS